MVAWFGGNVSILVLHLSYVIRLKMYVCTVLYCRLTYICFSYVLAKSQCTNFVCMCFSNVCKLRNSLYVFSLQQCEVLF